VGTSKPSVVETNVSQSAGSKASLAVVGRMAPAQGLEGRPVFGELLRIMEFPQEFRTVRFNLEPKRFKSVSLSHI
jgi:hypothetical protein